MLTQDGGDLGAVFGGVVDRLDQDERRRKQMGFSLPYDAHELCGLNLSGNGDETVAALLCPLAEFRHAWKAIPLTKWLLRPVLCQPSNITFLSSAQMYQCISYTAIGARGAGIQLFSAETCASIQQAQVGPAIVSEKLDEGRIHVSPFFPIPIRRLPRDVSSPLSLAQKADETGPD